MKCPTGHSGLRTLWAGVLLGLCLTTAAPVCGNPESPSFAPPPEHTPDSRYASTGTFWLPAALAAGTLVSEDLTCVITGGLIASGKLGWGAGIGACLFGILLGDIALYMAGWFLGRPALEKIPLRWMVHPEQLERAEAWFARRGILTVILSRFLPGIRLPAYVAAGILKHSPRVFLPSLLIGAVIWTPLLVGLSMLLAEKILGALDLYRVTMGVALFALLPAYLLITRLIIPAWTWRGRRLLAGQWRRCRRPEYWPAPLFYLPVAAWILLRGLKRENRLLDFTGCNPCMPAGGIIGESKSAILNQIGDTAALPAYAVFPAEADAAERTRILEDFMASHRLTWPVVLKPDVGQRGRQVAVVNSRSGAGDVLQASRGQWIAQAFVPGEEFGVFMVRNPETGNWEIFDITLKTPAVVTGDGHHTLEELILRDSRAVCQAKVHFRALHARLQEVPGPGEQVTLSTVGNHCRGTRFENGTHLTTPALLKRMTGLCESMPGFHFGRFDIKAPDREAFQRGEDLQVLELNGVTSEATGLYDPDNHYLSMVNTLIRQWKWASVIGRANREQGHPIAAMSDLIHSIDTMIHLRRSRNAGQAAVK